MMKQHASVMYMPMCAVMHLRAFIEWTMGGGAEWEVRACLQGYGSEFYCTWKLFSGWIHMVKAVPR